MSQDPSSQGASTGSLTGALTGMFKSFTGAGASGPAPIKTHPPVERQDSLPELVGTPSDIGIWETSHELRGKDGRFTWKRLFQDPRTYREPPSPQHPPSPPPPTSQGQN